MRSAPPRCRAGALRAKRQRKIWPAIPTLPQGCPCSTIGDTGLNFRVRNGIGCTPCAIITGQTGGPSHTPRRAQRTADAAYRDRVDAVPTESSATFMSSDDWASQSSKASLAKKPIGRLVRVSFTHCCACTPRLSTRWSSWVLQGKFISRGASRLDAFSGYPVRTWLPSHAAGATTGAPEVRPSRSSRTKDSSSQLSCAHSR